MITLDHAFVNARMLFGVFRFFRDGWGPYHDRHTQWLRQLRNRALPPPSPDLPIVATPIASTPLTLFTFPSPAAHLLPPESRIARALYLPPCVADPPASPVHLHPAHGHAERDARPAFHSPLERVADNLVPTLPSGAAPIALILPATGDHGFLRRLALHGAALRARGIGSLVLESPFYGRRRPPGQISAQLRSVHQLADLGRATIEEARVLLTRLRAAGHAQLAVAGMSQGGLHAAMVASALPFALGVVAAFAPHSAVPVFTEGVLADVVDWAALGDDGRQKMREVLSVSDIANFPPPTAAGREILLVARNDR